MCFPCFFRTEPTPPIISDPRPVSLDSGPNPQPCLVQVSRATPAVSGTHDFINLVPRSIPTPPLPRVVVPLGVTAHDNCSDRSFFSYATAQAQKLTLNCFPWCAVRTLLVWGCGADASVRENLGGAWKNAISRAAMMSPAGWCRPSAERLAGGDP